jgi:hypothetical protein
MLGGVDEKQLAKLAGEAAEEAAEEAELARRNGEPYDADAPALRKGDNGGSSRTVADVVDAVRKPRTLQAKLFVML